MQRLKQHPLPTYSTRDVASGRLPPTHLPMAHRYTNLQKFLAKTPTENNLIMSLDRNLTHVAIVEYLDSQPQLAPLAASLNDTVDGNVLIDAVKLWKSPNPAAIKPYFEEEAAIGAFVPQIAATRSSAATAHGGCASMSRRNSVSYTHLTLPTILLV